MFEEKKVEFIKRMNKYFSKQEKIHFRELEILLNDDFINELSFIIKSEVGGIVERMLERFRK